MISLLNEFNRGGVGFEGRKFPRRKDERAGEPERGVREAGEDPHVHMIATLGEVHSDGDGERAHES